MRGWLGVCGSVALLVLSAAVPAHAGSDEDAARITRGELPRC